MLASILRLFALRPFLTMAIFGIPIIILVAVGLITIMALKFIVSHPAVTCAIPATSSIVHIRENLGAAYGRVPDESMRRRMIADIENL